MFYLFCLIFLSERCNKCGPEIPKQQHLPDDNLNENKTSLKMGYIIPASITAAGLVATPFLLGSLGGNINNNKKNKKKT